MTSWFAQPRPPWWRLVTGPQNLTALAEQAANRGILVRTLPGGTMRHVPGVLATFADAWAFPSYFGHNWSALEDCLTDLGWLPAPGYLCLVADAEQLLRQAPSPALAVLLDLIGRAGASWAEQIAIGEPWDRPGRPFHLALGCPDAAATAELARRIRVSGAELSGAELDGAELDGGNHPGAS